MVNENRKKRAVQVQTQTARKLPSYVGRRRTVLGLLCLGLIALVARAVDQHVIETDFLQNEGERRHLRVVKIPAHRGMIMDRNGAPLAISTPVDSVWANPKLLSPDRQALALLEQTLGKNQDDLRRLLARRSDRAFVYLKRRANPDMAEQVMALAEEHDLNGIGLQREYRRYYPDGEVFAHVLGFTDVDDRGQEGMELAYNDWLVGEPGAKRVIQDGRARVVKDVENIRAPHPGQDLILSLDRRLQYLAHSELKIAVQKHKARSGSVVILDVRTGEVLAMVNQPAYNPNGSRDGRGGILRNRALTDVFEPGSTMKPFAISAALELGQVTPATIVDTSPGTMRVGREMVQDHHNYGVLDVSGVIQKSSNVGVSKIALNLPKETLWRTLSDLGFGQVSASGFPGESAGQLSSYQHWTSIDQATLSFGYGLSVTPLQLAQAYSVLAADGVLRPVSLMRQDAAPAGKLVMSAATARSMRVMLEGVVSAGGTALQAAVYGYRVAGKTGTVKKSIAGGYAEDRYLAVFAGMAPVSDPRLVMVVMLNEPSAGEFYGGQVAAPVFSKVMAGALRLLNITPDAITPGVRLAGGGVRP
ncbi:Cell division protein FtsI [Peptidoglycan synthetase] [hydrothermal vent metagenome]|uniref:Cell division protein FtsI [Peptidoglycan synthetase] n=1 Tax=hydrothermal vent metagenome TaxID=652676 RepID=A0A3B1BEE5_9ZZZZ